MTIFNVGANRTYTSINSAYDLASTGDTLLIDEGTYYEDIYMNNKIVNLVGRTDYPAEGNVIVMGSDRWGTLQMRWTSTNSVTSVIEGISFKTAISNAYELIYFIYLANVLSGLNVVFNKCTFNSTNIPINYYMFDNEYTNATGNPLNSFTIQNCDCYTYLGYFGSQYFTSIPTRVMQKCRISTTPTNFNSTPFTPPNYDFISTNTSYYGYGPIYAPFIIDLPDLFSFSGVVKENGTPVDRELRLFRTDNDIYLGSAVSSSVDGTYTLGSTTGGSHYIICLDAEDAIYFNDKIKSKCYPVQTSFFESYTNFPFSLANPGAETVCLSGWTVETGAPNVYSSGYNSSYKFGGGGAGTKVLSQKIDLVAQGVTTSGIDTESYFIVAKAMKQSPNTAEGDIYIGTRLYDETQSLIGTDHYMYKENTSTAWAETTYQRAVISGTRYIDLMMKTVNATYAVSSYFDDVSAYLRVPESYDEEIDKLKYLDLVNAGAETNSLAGWTLEQGTFILKVIATSEYAFYSDTSGTSTLSQRVNLVSKGISTTVIDQGRASFFIKANVRILSLGASEKVYIGIRSVNEALTVIDTDLHELNYIDTDWHYYTVNSTLPSGTRYVDVLLQIYSLGTGRAWYDDVQPWVTISG